MTVGEFCAHVAFYLLHFFSLLPTFEQCYNSKTIIVMVVIFASCRRIIPHLCVQGIRKHHQPFFVHAQMRCFSMQDTCSVNLERCDTAYDWCAERRSFSNCITASSFSAGNRNDNVFSNGTAVDK
jgi:hypothetical protein